MLEIKKLSNVSMIGDTRRWFYAIEWIELVGETPIEQGDVFTDATARDKEAAGLAALRKVTKVVTYDLEGDGMASQGEARSYIECNSRLED
jgi:hypothetical protein